MSSGIDVVVISRYERGVHIPSAGRVARLALTLGVTTDELLGVADETDPTGAPISSRRLRERLKAADSLPREDQETVVQVIDAMLAKNR